MALAAAAAGTVMFLRGRSIRGGLLFGAATLLRPEAAWYTLAVLAASSWLTQSPRWKDRVVAGVAALAVLAPFAIYSVWHFQTLFTPHVAANSGNLAEGWMTSRTALGYRWFLQPSTANFWRVSPALVCLAVPLTRTTRLAGRGFLWTVAAIDIALVLLTAPNDGGAQWGPRYLLFACIPLAILMGDAAQSLARRGTAGIVVVALVAAAALWTGRTAYRELLGTKQTYGRLVDFLSRELPPGSYAVTDLWWLDQVAATLTSSRQFVYVPNANDGHAIVRRLSDAVVPSVTVIRSASESPDTASWRAGSCYFEEQRATFSIRDVVVVHLRHRCGSGL